MNDRVSRLDLEINENTVVEKPDIEEIKSTKPELSTQPCKKETCELSIAKGQAELKTPVTGNPCVQTSKTDQLFVKKLPAFVKIVKPNVQKFNGNPLEYSKFKAAVSVKGSAKSCLAKFMPVSEKYEEA